MGSLFGHGLTTPTQVEQGGVTTKYDTPAQASTAAAVKSVTPTKMYDDSNPQLNDDGSLQLSPTTTPATTTKPTFLQASRDATGMPTPLSPSLTKGGKLLAVLGSAAKGGASGAGSMTFGEGFQHGAAEEPNEALRRQAVTHGALENSLVANQVQMLPWQRAIMAANLGKTQAEIGKYGADTKAAGAKAVLDEAEAVSKRYMKGEDGLIYDLSGGQPKPISGQDGQFVPVDAEMQKVNPNLKVGQPIPLATANKIKTLANSGIETINAGGRVKTVNKATNEVLKDWGASNAIVNINAANPFAGATLPLNTTGTTNDAALAKLSPLQQTAIKGIANYEIDPNAARARGLSPIQAITLAKQYDPQYDETQYATKGAIRKDFTSGQSAKLGRNLNTAASHLDQLSQAVDYLDPTKFPELNKIANALGFHVGSDKMTNFNTVKQAVAGELASIYKGTGIATDPEIAQVSQNILASNSPDALKGSINESIKLMHGRLGAMQYQYETGMGKPANFEIVSPKARQVFAAHGIKVEPTKTAAPNPSGTTPATKNTMQPTNALEEKYKDLGAKFPGAKP